MHGREKLWQFCFHLGFLQWQRLRRGLLHSEFLSNRFWVPKQPEAPNSMKVFGSNLLPLFFRSQLSLLLQLLRASHQPRSARGWRQDCHQREIFVLQAITALPLQPLRHENDERFAPSVAGGWKCLNVASLPGRDSGWEIEECRQCPRVLETPEAKGKDVKRCNSFL